MAKKIRITHILDKKEVSSIELIANKQAILDYHATLAVERKFKIEEVEVDDEDKVISAVVLVDLVNAQTLDKLKSEADELQKEIEKLKLDAEKAKADAEKSKQQAEKAKSELAELKKK